MEVSAGPVKFSAWHSLGIPDLAQRLETTATGLTSALAAQRLQSVGPNVVSHRGPPSALRLFLAQFRSPLIGILLVAAAISYAVGEHTDALVILGVVFFNAFIGLWQEWKASRAMEQLRSLTPQTVNVLRDGVERLVPSEELVAGDVVILEPGSVVAADGRLIEAFNLKVDEAVFTGESVAVEKGSAPLPAETPLLERSNCAWRGTTVVAGRGRLLVAATGKQTRLGEIVQTVGETRHEPTPFQKNLGAFSQKLTVFIVILGAFVFLLGVARSFPAHDILLLSVSLVVSLIPEGLPVVITLTLAWAMWQMARRKALLRKLAAVDALGAVTTIAADKTGTLTFGQMMVEEVFVHDRVVTVSGKGYGRTGDFFHRGAPVDPLADTELGLALKVGVLCNDARFSRDANGREQAIGDPTELALLVAGGKAGLAPEKLRETMPRVGEFPFDFQLRYMVTIHTLEDGRQFIAVKGAPRQVLELCQSVSYDGRVVPFTRDAKARVRREFEAMAIKALRGLALAYAVTTEDLRSLRPQHLQDHLIFLGLFGLRDPIRPEARQTVEQVRAAGIRLLMLTGDYRVTAEAVAMEIGLMSGTGTDALLDGRELLGLDDAALKERLRRTRVASRVSPEDKFRIARVLREQGEIVAMTGDGINDVPALATANVGIAIGATATDAAKEAADMVVTDGNLSSIMVAVAAGRTIYRNIQRVLFYLLSSNFAELLVILFALFGGFPLPLLPSQIIWLNAITDPFMGLALAREPSSASVFREPPRPIHQPVISDWQWFRIGLLALTIALSTFVLFVVEIAQGVSGRQLFAVTLTTVAFAQWLAALTFRSARRSLVSIIGTNRAMLPALLIVIALQLLILYLPRLASLFHVAPLRLSDWVLVIAFSLPVVLVDEIRKAIIRRRAAA